MYGLKVHQAVPGAGEVQTGVTVHYVTEEYDQGQIIRQSKLEVLNEDNPESLAGRLLPVEHELLVNVLKELSE